MEVFGGVPQFLDAFGYGPNGNKLGTTTTWIESATRIAPLRVGTRFVVEHTDLKQRGGPLKRRADVTLGAPVDLSEGAVTLNVVDSGATNSIVIPFIDIATVFKDVGDSAWVLRVTGTLEGGGTQRGGVRYVALDRGPV
jgi:hypothetical protein